MTPSVTDGTYLTQVLSKTLNTTDTSLEEEGPDPLIYRPATSGLSDIGVYAQEDWFGSEVLIPRDTDRILEQIVLMLLRIGAYMKKEGLESIKDSKDILKSVSASWYTHPNITCSAMNGEDTETPPHVGSSRGNIASYLRDYPQIFMKKQGALSQTELTLHTLNTVHSQLENDEDYSSVDQFNQNEEISPAGLEKVASRKKITIVDTPSEDRTVKIKLPSESLKPGTSRESILKVSSNKSITSQKILKEESNLKEISSNILNLSKDEDISEKSPNKTELTENKIREDNKNIELPLRILSIDDNLQETKESKKDNDKDGKPDDEKTKEVDKTESTESHSNNQKKT